MSEAPPENGKGLDGSDTAKALISTPRQPRRQTGLATAELSFGTEPVKISSDSSGKNLGASLDQGGRDV